MTRENVASTVVACLAGTPRSSNIGTTWAKIAVMQPAPRAMAAMMIQKVWVFKASVRDNPAVFSRCSVALRETPCGGSLSNRYNTGKPIG